MKHLPKSARFRELVARPELAERGLYNHSFYEFLKRFWPEVSSDDFISNWHIEYLCNELQELALRVSKRQPSKHDLIINVPPGSTKTTVACVMFPVWCWTQWHWMKFITASYSGVLSLESAEYTRDLMRSSSFQKIYPDIMIKKDKEGKSNYRVVKVNGDEIKIGGGRLSTSVGGSVTGFHGHILIVDDPLNPGQAASDLELVNATHWFDQTLSTRKIDKKVTPTILIMQRLHQADPSGHLLDKKNLRIKHICIPGEIRTAGYQDVVRPQELISKYVDDLMDPIRMDWEVMLDLEERLGQFGYASQIGQTPTSPKGGMFQIDRFILAEVVPEDIVHSVRYWDKAGTDAASKGSSKAAWTVGTKMARMKSGKFIILDVKRGRWSTDERENIIRSTAEADGHDVVVWQEQEPGSGGKDQAQATIRNLAGYSIFSDRPTGDKIHRADPYSVQVNNYNVMLLKGDWVRDFLDEHRYFPFSKFKDQVDSASGAISKLALRRRAGVLLSKRAGVF